MCLLISGLHQSAAEGTLVSAEPELHAEDDGAEAGDRLEVDYMAVGDEILDADTDY